MQILNATTNAKQTTPSKPNPGPWRILASALFVLALALLVQITGSFIVAFVMSFHNSFVATRGLPSWTLPSWVSTSIAIALFQLTWLWLTLRRAARTIGGKWSGLGITPVAHRLRLVGFVLATEVFVLFWVSLLVMIGIIPSKTAMSVLAKDWHDHHVLAEATVLIVISVLLPAVVEEFFFRGWLWGTLQPTWRPIWVSTTTLCFWLLLHVPDGWARTLYLLPLGIMVTVARHYWNSVKAPIVLHMTNNLVWMGLSVALAG